MTSDDDYRMNECGCSQIHQKIIYRGMGRQHHWTDFGINFWLWQVMFYLCGVLAGNPSRVLFWHWLKCGERSGVSRPRQTRDVNLWHHQEYRNCPSRAMTSSTSENISNIDPNIFTTKHSLSGAKFYFTMVKNGRCRAIT